MEYNTSELCEMFLDVVDVVEPMFSNYGGCSSFGGAISTVKCFEDNGVIADVLAEDGEGPGAAGSMVAARCVGHCSMPPWRKLPSTTTGKAS